jgi:1-phosphofructokinase
MVGVLDQAVVLCASFGGEAGAVVRGLVQAEGLALADIETAGANGAYVHDRRDGERAVVASLAPAPLSRHEVDDLYSVAVARGLVSRVAVLAGTSQQESPLPTDTYRRLAHDLRVGGTMVVADLSGPLMHAALDGGVDVLKTSDEDLARDGLLDEGADEDAVIAVLEQLASMGEGAGHVVVTRGEKPAIALSAGEVVVAEGPEVEVVDAKGAGDSLTAGLTAGLAEGMGFEQALRLGVAAATLNVTRRGLATGHRDAILELTEHVRVEATTRGANR